MPATIYYDSDADLSVLKGKTIAILGYGSQGHAQAQNLQEGDVLMCSHGFNIHFGQVEPPPGVDALLVAPKGPGHLVRSEFEKGGGVPCLVAVYPGSSPETLKA